MGCADQPSVGQLMGILFENPIQGRTVGHRDGLRIRPDIAICRKKEVGGAAGLDVGQEIDEGDERITGNDPAAGGCKRAIGAGNQGMRFGPLSSVPAAAIHKMGVRRVLIGCRTLPHAVKMVLEMRQDSIVHVVVPFRPGLINRYRVDSGLFPACNQAP